ncbi:S24 family peptidase, partial [Pseudomonas syringae]
MMGSARMNSAADHIEQDFSFDRLMDLRAPHIYVAKIDGDSMEGAKIFHDSLVVVDRSRKRPESVQETVRNF